MRAGPIGPLLALALAVACGRDGRPEAAAPEDAGAPAGEVRLPEHGLVYRLPTAWRPEGFAPPPPPARLLAAATRSPAPGEPPFRVAPRLVCTEEPAGEGPSAAVFARVVQDLQGLGHRSDARVERTGFSARTLEDAELGDVRLRFRIGESGPRLLVRSLVVVRPLDAPRVVLALTASYLEEDRARVEPELDRMYDRLEINPPAEPGRAAPKEAP